MKLILVSLAFIATAIAARYADAADKPSKPVVCVNYAVAKTDKANDDAVAICYDGKKPALFYRFAEVSAPGKSEGTVKVLVGWR